VAQTRRRMQGAIGPTVLLPLVATLILGAGCDADDDGADYVAVCTDHQGVRVDDAKCDHAPAAYTHDAADTADPWLWYYLGTSAGHTAPPIGSRATGGVYRTPVTVRVNGNSPRAATVARGGVSTSGGSVARGGFGVSRGASGAGS
jgi:hypothetical protein